MAYVGIVFMVLTADLFPGIISVVKAKTAGRKAPSLLQPCYDVWRLFNKGAVYGQTTGVIFKLAPLVYFATTLTAMLLLPFHGNSGIFSFQGDFVLFAYLLGLGKFFMIIGAMDTGSGFEGMGANREAFYSLLIEPAFFILMGSLALLTDHISFGEMFTQLQVESNLSILVILLAVYILVFVTMIENSRLPVDDPKTHLELTMVHEVMVLDHSGFDLAIIHFSGWLKFVIFGALMANFLIPIEGTPMVKYILFVLIQLGLAGGIGILESFRARNKMAKNPQWILMLPSLAVIVFLATLIISLKLVFN